MRRLLVAFSLVLFLGPAATAPAAPVDLGITSDALDVAMTKDGAAHVARLTGGSFDPVLVVCRIPAGGTACTQTASKPLPFEDPTGPWVVTDGTKVTVAAGTSDGAHRTTSFWTSATGTDGYPTAGSAPVKATDVELSPAGDQVWIAAAAGPAVSGADPSYHAFAAAPLAGASASAAVLGSASGSQSVDGELLGVTPQGKPLAFLSGFAPDLPKGDYYRPFTGTPAQLNSASAWGPRVSWALPAPSERNGGYDVASGNGRLWVAYAGLQRDTVLRPWTGAGLGPAVAADCVDDRFSAGLQEAPDVAIGRTGGLLVTEVGSDGDRQHLGYFQGSADGGAFSAYQELAAGDRIQDVETAADPTTDAGGIVVWTSDDIDQTKGELSFERLTPAGPTDCKDGAGTGGSSTKAVSGGKVGGAKLTLRLPKACVGAGKGYRLRLSFTKPARRKRRRKGAFVRVKEVVFSGTGAKRKTDRKAPFRKTLTVKPSAKSGGRVTVKVEVTVKRRHAKDRRKTIKATFRVC